MLEEASKKGVYKHLEEHTLGNPEEFPEKFKNQFAIPWRIERRKWKPNVQCGVSGSHTLQGHANRGVASR